MTLDYETVKAFSSFAGMMLFMGIFLGVVIWTFKPGSKAEHAKNAQIPFNEEKSHDNN